MNNIDLMEYWFKSADEDYGRQKEYLVFVYGTFSN